MGSGGRRLVVSMLTRYSKDPSSNPTEVYRFFFKTLPEK